MVGSSLVKLFVNQQKLFFQHTLSSTASAKYQEVSDTSSKHSIKQLNFLQIYRLALLKNNIGGEKVTGQGNRRGGAELGLFEL